MSIVNECEEVFPFTNDDPHRNQMLLDGAKAELLLLARQQVFS